MKYINVVNGPQNASSIIMGCMRMPALSVDTPPPRKNAGDRGYDEP